MASSATTPSSAVLLTSPQPSGTTGVLYGGPSTTRPAGPLLGQLYYDTTLGYEIVWNSLTWVPVVPPVPNAVLFGTLAQRPLSPYNGQPYYDTTLGGLECWNGSAWIFIGPSAVQALPSPVIVQQPSSLQVNVGSAAAFTVLATGTGSLSYQWYFNGISLGSGGGAQTNQYSIGSAAQSNGGSYYVIVTNAGGSTQSVTVTLTVTGTPFITGQPTSGAINAGQSWTFTVTATGTPPLAYQWYFAGAALPNATNSSLVISNATTANTGSYYVNVSNGGGGVNSNTVTLTVTAVNVFACTSFTGICVSNSTYPGIVGFDYSNAGTVQVVLSALGGNLPSTFTLSAFTSSGSLITSAQASGSTSSITVQYPLTGSGSSTIQALTTQVGLLAVQMAVSVASGTMVFTNISLRATIYGPVVYNSPYGYAMNLSSNSVASGSTCTVDFMPGTVVANQFLGQPNCFYTFQGSTSVANPYTFTPSGSVSISGNATGSTVQDARLDINAAGIIG